MKDLTNITDEDVIAFLRTLKPNVRIDINDGYQ
jgi:hypothetical protein